MSNNNTRLHDSFVLCSISTEFQLFTAQWTKPKVKASQKTAKTSIAFFSVSTFLVIVHGYSKWLRYRLISHLSTITSSYSIPTQSTWLPLNCIQYTLRPLLDKHHQTHETSVSLQPMVYSCPP